MLFCLNGEKLLNNEVKAKILEFIRKNENLCSGTDISKQLKINRITVTKYISTMRSEGIIDYHGMGMAKSWYIAKNDLLGNFNNGNGRQLREVLDLVGEGVCITDNDNKIVWLNKIAKNTYCKKEDYVGGSCCEIFNCGDHCTNGDIKKILIEKGVYKFDCKLKDGTKINNIASPLLDKDEVVGSIRIMMG